MTLVEIMIGVFVITATSLSILAGLLQGRRLAESSLLDETALIVAQSYLEDIKGVAYSSLDSAIIPVRQGGLATGGATSIRRVDFKKTAFTGDDLHVELRPSVVQTASPSALRPVSAYEIRLTYSWRTEGSAPSTAKTRTIRVIRSVFTSF